MSAEFPQVAHADRTTIVIGALVSMFLAALDQTIVAPALPTLETALGDPQWLSWIVSAYLLTATAVTPLYGRIADSRGRRPTLVAAIVIFLAGSLVCGLAPSMPVLIAGRALQGLGGGGLVALAQTIIGDVVPPRERAQYAIYFSGLWAVASLGGPVLGGILTEHLHWSAIFWINMPIGAAALIISRRALARLPDVRHDRPIDFLGGGLVIAATMALMLALTWGGQGAGWFSPAVLGTFAAGLVLYVLLAIHLGRSAAPLVPLHVLRNAVVPYALTGMFFCMGGNVGLTVYAPGYLERVHGLTPAQGGFGLVALLAGTVIGAAAASRLMRRTERYKLVGIAGGLIGLAAYLVMGGLLPHLSLTGAELCFIVLGFGIGSSFPVITVAVQNAVTRTDLGVTTAGLAFSRTLGGVFGVAIFGAIMLASGAIAGLGGETAQVGDAEAERVIHGFRLVLFAGALAQTLGLLFFMRMKELPLRGSVEAAPPVVD